MKSSCANLLVPLVFAACTESTVQAPDVDDDPVDGDALFDEVMDLDVDADVQSDGDGGDATDGGDASDGDSLGDPVPDDDPIPVNPLDGRGQVTLVDDTYGFLEGPRWIPSLSALLFTDIQANTIYRLDPPSTIAPWRNDSQGANGLGIDAQGRILACEHTSRRLSRQLSNGTWETVHDRYMGDRLNSPNDVIVRSDGSIYFTDPPYATPSGQGELAFSGVFRVDPSGVLHAEWEGALTTRPNGVMLSPDEETLYVADTEAGGVMKFDVASDGSLSAPSPFSSANCNGDGMAIDEAGNLFVACAAGQLGVLVLKPDGTTWGHIAMSVGPTNVGFGDTDKKTLYITTPDALSKVRLSAPGIY